MSSLQLTGLNHSQPHLLQDFETVSEDEFFKDLKENMEAGSFQKAIEELFFLVASPKIPSFSQLYSYLFELMPHFSENDFEKLIKWLPHLLELTSSLSTEQFQLAVKLANRHTSLPSFLPSFDSLSSYQQAMDYLAKASQKVIDLQAFDEDDL